MPIFVDQQFTTGIEVIRSTQHQSFCTLTIGEGHWAMTTFFFHSVEQIEVLVEALQDLANDFAASRPADPEAVPIGQPDPLLDACC